MGWPAVSCFTSSDTVDCAKTNDPKSETTIPNSNKRLRGTNKPGAVMVFLFMVRSGCFSRISPRLVAPGRRERVGCLAMPRAEGRCRLKQFAQALAGLV